MARAAATTPIPHPHIVRTEGVCGGSPRIRGTRLAVWGIAELYQRGEPIEELEALYPHVDPAAIRDAISYYLDHRQEIDDEIEANSLETALRQANAVLGEDGVVRFL
jgi:uncharacterized protein (DUF433 family)